MKLLTIAVFLTVIPGIKKSRGLLPRELTQAVSGICACMIMLSHSLYSYDIVDAWNAYPGQIFMFDQLVVAPFFFFSGYGVVLSFRKRPDYIRTLPRRKMLPLYLRLAAVETVCVVLALILKTGFDGRSLLFSYFCYGTVLFGRLGSCSWFVAVMILLWGAIWISWRLFPKKETSMLIMATILAAELHLLFRLLHMSQMWWDTVLVFPFGLWVGHFAEKLDSFFKKYKLLSIVLSAIFLLLTVLFDLWSRKGKPNAFLPAPILMCAAISTLSTRLTAGNRFLKHCGSRALYLYLVQEPVLRLLQHLESLPNESLRRALPFLFRPEGGRIHLYAYLFFAFVAIFLCAECFIRIERIGSKWLKRKKSG